MNWKEPDYAAELVARQAKLAHLREEPARFLAVKLHYAENPVDFINDWGFTYDPRRAAEGLESMIPFLLWPRQVDFINWLKERWESREDGLVEKSRDMGLTWLCVAFFVWAWLFRPGVVMAFGSRVKDLVDKIGDPDCIFWKIRVFIEMLPEELQPVGYRRSLHAPFLRISNPENGSVIRGEGGENLGRGGRSSLHVLDEAAHVEHAEAVEAALSQNANCRISVSTPNGPGNLFYRKRMGGRIKVFIFDWKHDPRKGPVKDGTSPWYEEQKLKLDAVTLAQEVDRNYEGSVDDIWINGNIVEAAMRRGPADIRPIGRLRVGVDPARFGRDKSVITFRRGRVLFKVERRGQIDIVSCASWVRDEVNNVLDSDNTLRLEQIAVDTVGLGAGVADTLRTRQYFPDRDVGRGELHRIVVDVNSSLQLDNGKDYNLRAYMAREVKEWLTSASIPNDTELKADLTCFKYSYKAGLLLIESKDEIKKRLGRSPDSYDSLALTFAVPTAVEEAPQPVRQHSPAVAGTGM